MSTTSAASQSFPSREAAKIVTRPVLSTRTARGVESLPPSVDGRPARLRVSAQRELDSNELRSRMQDARGELATHLQSDGQSSLTALRLSRGLSQQQLAAAIGTSQPHIAKIESGRGANLMLDTAARLAKALGVSIDAIWALLEQGRAAVNE